MIRLKNLHEISNKNIPNSDFRLFIPNTKLTWFHFKIFVTVIIIAFSVVCEACLPIYQGLERGFVANTPVQNLPSNAHGALFIWSEGRAQSMLFSDNGKIKQVHVLYVVPPALSARSFFMTDLTTHKSIASKLKKFEGQTQSGERFLLPRSRALRECVKRNLIDGEPCREIENDQIGHLITEGSFVDVTKIMEKRLGYFLSFHNSDLALDINIK
jgi:hypothetical protein